MNRIASALIEHGRAMEWVTSLTILAFAITLSMPGDTLSSPAFRTFVELGLDEATLATPLALMGGVRLAALYINGSWRRSPYLRMAGAISGAAIFGALALAIIWPTLHYGANVAPVSTGFGTYLVLSLADLLSSYRSGADAQLSRLPRC